MRTERVVCLNDVIISANTGLDAIKRAPIVDYDSGIRCLRIQDISQIKDYNNWGFCKVESKSYDKFQLKENDIIIARTGATIGVNRFIKSNIDAVYNNGLIRIRINENVAYPKFIYYCMQSQKYKDFINSICAGTTTQPNMKINAFLDFKIYLPKMEMQRNIVNVLEAFDDTIENSTKKYNNLERQMQILFANFILKCSKQYSCTIEAITKSVNTGADAIQRAPIVDYDTGIRCVRVGDMTNQRNFPEWGYAKVTSDIFKQYQLIRDDIIVTRTASLGINRLITENLQAVYNNGLIRLRMNQEKVLPLFIFRHLQTTDFSNYIKRIENETSVRPNMKIKYLLEYEFICPPMDEQVTFIDSISNMFRLQDNLGKEKYQLQKLKDALLPRLMSGAVDISEL